MDNDQMKHTVRRFWEGMNSGDLESQLSLCAEDAVFTVSGTTPVSGSKSGIDAIRTHFLHFGSLVEQNPKMKVRTLVAEGNTVVCLSEGTMRAQTGRPYGNSYAFVFTFRDGKIESVTEYLDTALVETSLFGKTIS